MNKKSINSDAKNGLSNIIFSIMTVSFLLSLVSIWGIGHSLIDTYVKGNLISSTPAIDGSFEMLRVLMATLIVTLPSWIIAAFIFKQSPKESTANIRSSANSLIVIGVYITFLISLINLIYVIYLILGFELSIQEGLHLLVTLTVCGLSYGFMSLFGTANAK